MEFRVQGVKVRMSYSIPSMVGLGFRVQDSRFDINHKVLTQNVEDEVNHKISQSLDRPQTLNPKF